MLRRARIGRLALAASLVVLLGSGCTPDPDPKPTPTPAPVTPTPTESDQEREQRLAYEDAEKSYTTYRAEFERVLAAGGAEFPTAIMKQNAGGQYLRDTQAVAEAFKGLKHYSRGREKIVYVHRGGYEPSSLLLDVCEDSRSVITFDRKGKKLYVGDIRVIQIGVKQVGGIWKLWTGKGRQVSSC